MKEKEEYQENKYPERIMQVRRERQEEKNNR